LAIENFIIHKKEQSGYIETDKEWRNTFVLD